MNKEKQIIEEFRKLAFSLFGEKVLSPKVYGEMRKEGKTGVEFFMANKNTETRNLANLEELEGFLLKALKSQRKEIVEKIRKIKEHKRLDQREDWIIHNFRKRIINLITKEDE